MDGKAAGAARVGTLGTLGARLLNFTSILAVGSGLGLVLAMVRLAVLTRLLEISVYGQLTLLIVMAALVTMLIRMAIVTGSLMMAFRGGEEDTGVEEDEPAPEPEPGDQQRRALGAGLVGSLLLTAALVGGVAALARPIDEFLIDSGGGFAVVAATVLGGLDGSYRLVSHVPRFERRPVTFVALQLVHAALGLGVAVVLIEAGYGLEGAIAGLALGTALAFVPAVWVTRHRFSLSLDFDTMKALAIKGAPMIAIIGGFTLFRYADVFMVSRYLSDEDVAMYRAAARIGGVASSLVGGVILAWGPLTQGPLRGALHREGLIVTAGARLLTYFWLVVLWLIVAFVLLRDVLIRVAPAEYSDAAVLIPMIALAAASVSGVLVVSRASRMKAKRNLLTALALVMPLVLVGLSIVLIPRFGIEGAAAAAMATPLAAAGVFLFISERTSLEPIGMPWARLILATSLGAAYGALGVVLTGAIGDAEVPLSVALALAFPAALVLAGALPREEARNVVRLIGLSLRRPSAEDSLSLLGERDVEILEALVRRRRPVREVARAADRSEDELLEHFVTLLREVGDIGEPTATDGAIGRYLLSSKNVNLRAREGHLLALEGGVSPMEVDGLTLVVDRLRGMSERRWKEATERRAPERQAMA